MHRPVLLQEVVEGLSPKAGETILDATVGGGGHSEALCRAMGGTGRFVCLDEDGDAIARSRERLKECGCEFLFRQMNFRKLDEALDSFGIREAHRILFDLGMSSFQLAEGGRGFSFQKDEPLRMTFANSVSEGALTAEAIVNEWDERRIAATLFAYGEERFARRLARAVVERRARGTIATARELAELILRTVGRRGRTHPATKTFQALRIAVNDELGALGEALPKAFARLSPSGGRMAVISFHSMEDRIVKRFFNETVREGKARLAVKKPISPRREELAENPRARSAKLRILEKI